MAGEFDQSRTEAPTPRRREEARRKGDVALSRDLAGGLVLLGAVLLFAVTGRTISECMAGGVRDALSHFPRGDWTVGHTAVMAKWASGTLVRTIGWAAGGLLLLTLGASLLQTGPTFTLQPLSPDWERLAPARNMSKLFSLESAARGLLAVCKVAAVLLVVFAVLKSELGVILAAGRGTLPEAVGRSWAVVLETVGWSAGVLVVIGAADFIFQRVRHEQKLRMTREELKEEQKEDEGDPHLKTRLRKLQREAAQKQGINDVPQATVVLTNPTHYAVALRYDRNESPAPQVLAKGEGLIARRIARIAEEHGIPVLERKPLTRMLYRLVDVGDEIPVELYQAVAEILAQVYRLKGAL